MERLYIAPHPLPYQSLGKRTPSKAYLPALGPSSLDIMLRKHKHDFKSNLFCRIVGLTITDPQISKILDHRQENIREETNSIKSSLNSLIGSDCPKWKAPLCDSNSSDTSSCSIESVSPVREMAVEGPAHYSKSCNSQQIIILPSVKCFMS